MFEDVSKLIVFKKSHELALKIYELTKKFPKDETFALTSQIRRAVVSIPSNIVEGKARNSDKEYKRFLYISRGSLEEVKYQILLSKDLSYITENDFIIVMDLINEIGRLLNGLISSLKQ